MTSDAPSMASKIAARCPTGPVPAKTTAFFPAMALLAASLATAAAAVVLLPLLSSITETRKLAKNRLWMETNKACPAAILLPPTKMAVFFLSLGARVKMAPSTIAPTFSGVNPPWPMTWSAPPS